MCNGGRTTLHRIPNDSMPPGLHFPPCRTCVPWFDHMPAELHFPPCRTCVSPADQMPANDRMQAAETGASREPFLDTGGQLNVQYARAETGASREASLDTGGHMPAKLHFLPCRTCVSPVDQMPANDRMQVAETGASREPFLDTGGQRNVQDQQHLPESRGPQNCRGLRPALHVPFLGAVRLLSDFAGLDMPAFALRFLGVWAYTGATKLTKLLGRFCGTITQVRSFVVPFSIGTLVVAFPSMW